ncbi:MAG: response regulator [Deltaproteobacteria bacterium]|nr:response regulator [Deltaproteobacteria bacterium]TLN03718.1 MAG: response regulator [bacterium]
MIDAIDEKTHEEKLLELETIVNQSPAVAFRWNADDKWSVQFVSDNIWQFGYRPEEFLSNGLCFADIIHPDDLPRVRENLARCTAEGVDEFSGEYRIIDGQGKVRWLDDRTVILRDENSFPLAYQGLLLDATDRKKYEQHVIRQKEMLQAILDIIPAMIVYFDTDQKIAYGNLAWETITGWTLEAMQERDLLEEFYPDPEYRHSASEFIARAEGVWQNFHIRVRDGRVIETRWANVKLSDGTNIGIGQDITDQKKLEEKVRLNQKLEAVGRLAGGIAHDFNNILTAIIGFCTLSKMRTEENDPVHQYQDRILSAAEKAAGLTQSLLAFSRKQMISVSRINLVECVNLIAEKLGTVLGDRVQLVIRHEFPVLQVVADCQCIEQIILSLASNSRDAMPDGGKVIIATNLAEMGTDFIRANGFGKVGRYACMTVTDTGVGMDPETQRNIFVPFFTTKNVGQGTGLGLPSAYGTVKQLGGFITAQSVLGSGSVFTIYLPSASEEIDRSLVERPAMVRPAVPLILLADDNELVRTVSRELLEKAGFAVVEAVDGLDAVEKFREMETAPDLLLFDIVMPRMNGMEAFQKIHEKRPELPVLFMSGYQEKIDPVRGLPEGAVEIVGKPVSPKDLVQKIRAILKLV